MRSKIIVMFLSLAMLVPSPAWAADRGALFKVTSGAHTLHLFGTMHVGKADFYPLESRIAGAIAGASVVAFEVDPMTDPALMAGPMRTYGMNAPGGDASRDMPAGLKARLEPVMKRAGLDMKLVEMFKPWMVTMLLGLHEYAALGYGPEMSVDMHVAKLARTAKAFVLELESADAQLALFGRMPRADQWRMLEESVAMIETGRQRVELDEVIHAWRNADQAMFDKVALRLESDDSVGGKFFQKVLLEERNGPMADKLAKLLGEQKNSVAAIGALHLVGKHGLPELLRKRGLKVERVY
ncbi:TraB/GumN family protein [Massilia glaciei]|uniref:TraB/GumN family protein n=1 Tax=Massilia glaciei TaxID=1524097 RepID=A0A2U2I723_9BURK|nr:TraB/GumN family protein [Massilia glaciei]PWF55551.1 TraB/GumN family protein [Massilia glaciei]